MNFKKYFTALLIAMLALTLAGALVACTELDKEITGVMFEDLTVDYDGQAHEITVKGAIPEGVKINYSNNTAVDAGVYTAYATLYGKGYLPLTLSAVLTINARPVPDEDITGVTFEDVTLTYDGNPHEITVSGALPKGVKVSYSNNTAVDAGEYLATAVLTGRGYNTLTLTATLTILLSDVDVNGVVFNNAEFDFDGDPHEIKITGNLPEGVSVRYENNVGVNAGEYIAYATFSQEHRNDVVLSAILKINPVNYSVVNNADSLLTAIDNGGLILFDDDIVFDNTGRVWDVKNPANTNCIYASITKDTIINGRGHTLSAINYPDQYRVIDVKGDVCKQVTVRNLNIVADKQAGYLRGINIRETKDLTLNVCNVNIDISDYYAFNILFENDNLTVNLKDCDFSAWSAVYNRASGTTFNAENCVFTGTNKHVSANSTSNYFTTFIVSEYVLLAGDEFTSVNLSANNRFTLKNCEIISKIVMDDDGEYIDTRQKLIDLRSPYNNSIELVDCTLTPVYYEDLIYSAYDSAYIPQANRDDPDYVINTNKVIIDGVDVTDNERYVEKYYDN